MITVVLYKGAFTTKPPAFSLVCLCKGGSTILITSYRILQYSLITDAFDFLFESRVQY